MSAKAIWSLGLIGLALLAGAGLYALLPPLEADLRQKTDTALIAAGMDDVQAEVSGLSVYLSLKPDAQPADPQGRLKDAADAVLALRPKSHVLGRISAQLPPAVSRFDGVHGPALEAVTDPQQKPLTLMDIRERISHAVSDL